MHAVWPSCNGGCYVLHYQPNIPEFENGNVLFQRSLLNFRGFGFNLLACRDWMKNQICFHTCKHFRHFQIFFDFISWLVCLTCLFQVRLKSLESVKISWWNQHTIVWGCLFYVVTDTVNLHERTISGTQQKRRTATSNTVSVMIGMGVTLPLPCTAK